MQEVTKCNDIFFDKLFFKCNTKIIMHLLYFQKIVDHKIIIKDYIIETINYCFFNKYQNNVLLIIFKCNV